MIGRTQLSEVEGDLEKTGKKEINAVAAQDVSDKWEIRCLVDEIDNAVDAKDWAICRQFFAEEVDVDFTSLAGGEPMRILSDDLIDGWRTNLFAEKKSHHMRSNHRIEIFDDRAEVFSKGYAFNLLENGEITGFWEVWGDYVHKLERTARGEWKVAGIIFTVTFKRGDEAVRTFTPQN